MRNRFRQGRIFMCFLVSLTISSLVMAQGPRPRMGVMRVGGSDESTEIRIAEWSDGFPSLLEIRTESTGKAIYRSMDPAIFAATSWEESEVQANGWVDGVLTVPTAGAMGTRYSVAYRELDGSSVEYRLHEEGDFGNEIVGIMPISDPGDAAPHPDFIVIFPIIIAIAAISGCYYAQIQAIRACVGTAGQSCVVGTYLKSARFRGICGMGECSIECAPLPPAGN